MYLPPLFLEKMKVLLGDKEYEEFLASYGQSRFYGLRVNTLKISVEDFLKLSPFNLRPIPWTSDGFYYEEGDTPGRHPYYHAGLYYIQEPSAMLPGEVMHAQPGDKVLDLCAAPGGKTVQLAAGMKGQGLLVANDIHSERTKALVKNVELYGIKNALVTNESPEKLAVNFTNYFNKILIDAPCSGEGMFRKDEDAARSWESFSEEKCSGMQWDILKTADQMLKEGGLLLYSTCTFSPVEDEKMISRFLTQFRNYRLVDIDKKAGMESGRPQWSDGNGELLKTARLWPHRLKGEGHFTALLQKNPNKSYPVQDACLQDDMGKMREHNEKALGTEAWKSFREFEAQCLNIRLTGYFYRKNDSLYSLPLPYPGLNGLKMAKFGWYLGDFLRGKFEPSHSLLLSLEKEDLKYTLNFSSQSEEIVRYLKGETLLLEGPKGWTAVMADGYPLGWAKQTGDMLKNMYPKGWRRMN